MIPIQEIVDPRTRSAQKGVAPRNVHTQTLDPLCRFRTFIHLCPNTRLVYNLTSPQVSAAARTVAQILWADLRADVLHRAEHTIAAGFAAKQGRFQKKPARARSRGKRSFIEPTKQPYRYTLQRPFLPCRERRTECVEHP